MVMTIVRLKISGAPVYGVNLLMLGLGLELSLLLLKQVKPFIVHGLQD